MTSRFFIAMFHVSVFVSLFVSCTHHGAGEALAFRTHVAGETYVAAIALSTQNR